MLKLIRIEQHYEISGLGDSDSVLYDINEPSMRVLIRGKGTRARSIDRVSIEIVLFP